MGRGPRHLILHHHPPPSLSQSPPPPATCPLLTYWAPTECPAYGGTERTLEPETVPAHGLEGVHPPARKHSLPSKTAPGGSGGAREEKGEEFTWQRLMEAVALSLLSWQQYPELLDPGSRLEGAKKGTYPVPSPPTSPWNTFAPTCLLPAPFLPRAVTVVTKGKKLGPRTRAVSSRARSPAHQLCDSGQGLQHLWASVSPSVKWGCSPAWPTCGMESP